MDTRTLGRLGASLTGHSGRRHAVATVTDQSSFGPLFWCCGSCEVTTGKMLLPSAVSPADRKPERLESEENHRERFKGFIFQILSK